MSESLVIRNFGPVKDAVFALKKTTIFTGEQGSGKSTVVKLIALFRSYIFITKKNLEFILKDYGIDSYVNPDTYLEYKNEYYEITIFENEINIRILEKLRKVIDYASISGEFILREDAAPYGDNENKRNRRYIDKLLEFGLLHKLFDKGVLYIPTERLLMSAISGSIFGLLSNDIALPKSLLRFGQQYELAKIEFNNFKIPVIDIKFHLENNVEFLIGANGHKIKLAESASGFQSIVPLILSTELFNNKISDSAKLSTSKTLIIEEPELNLFPVTQKKLAYYLAEKNNSSADNKLIIATHSPYILSAINNLLLASRIRNDAPQKAAAINLVIPEKYNLDHTDFECYFLSGGGVKSIFNNEQYLIGENDLDSISEEIGDEFNELLELL